MRLILPTVVIIICLAGSAQAEEYVDLYPAMDVCCMFSAVCIDLEYCGVCTENHPVTVQFLDVDGEVLGSTTITDNRCSGGADQLYADLDTAVDSVEVCSVRLITEADECCMAEWAAIKVLCQDPCDCDKW
ncbi:MAG TPA: hypothetical protein ENO21_00955, partial [Firmicutes bacterium]|nr:hypothetical protein [Bacillota bacterium]